MSTTAPSQDLSSLWRDTQELQAERGVILHEGEMLGLVYASRGAERGFTAKEVKRLWR